MHQFLLAHLLCALVESMISIADVVDDLRAQPGTLPLAPDPCFPQGEGQNFDGEYWSGVENGSYSREELFILYWSVNPGLK